LVIIFSALFSLFPHSSTAAETVIVNITLNRETKGEYFVNLTDDGDFLVKTADLQVMGVTGPFPRPVELANESYISLRSFPGIAFSFNEKTLTLDITAQPSLLPKRIIDFTPQEPMQVYYPRDTSAFLNYRLDYLSGNSFSFQGFNATNELGVRSGDFLLLSDSIYTKEETGSRFVRLSSSLIYDRRQEMQRFVGGDFAASSGDLGAGVNLGGVSFSKLYRINPYFINRPSAGLSGLVSLPSDLEIYQNGVRIRTDRLSPGGFELKDITGSGGASLVEVVVRDPFGREERIRYPFYFTDILLKKGLHEYSYNFGAIRKDFGNASNSYGKPAFSGFHNYGISDFVTLGLRGEWSGSVFNFGSQASFLSTSAGTFTSSLSGSYNRAGKTGVAGLFGYGYQGGHNISARLFIKGISKDYATIDPQPAMIITRYEADVGVGYSTRELGSLNLDYASTSVYNSDDTRSLTFSYSRNLRANMNLQATFKRTLDPVAGNEFFVGINYYPGKQINLAANYHKSGNTNTETLQMQKNQPLGEGIGFQAALERTDGGGISSNRVSPSIQYNAPHGIYAADYSWSETNGSATDLSRFSASGAIAFIGNNVGFIRPVSDSFALVKVGEVKDVRVYMNNQEMGRTDASGKTFVPDMGAFDYNQISIADKDVPMEYLLSTKLLNVSPPFRSGSCVIFDASRIQAVTGILSAKINNETKPLEYNELNVEIDGKLITFQTGSSGEFYLDNYSVDRAGAPDLQKMGCSALERSGVPFMKPGKYTASCKVGDKVCHFAFDIPATSESIIDLGKIICEFSPAVQ
jgi:outer membrane usher protein FimD/PapC